MFSLNNPLLKAVCAASFCLFAGGMAYSADDEPSVPLERLDEIIPDLRGQITEAVTASTTLEIEGSRLEYQKAATMRNSSKKGTDVRFGSSVGYQKEDSAGISSDAFKYTYNFSVSRPLYHWGAPRAEHEYGQLGLERAKLGYNKSFLDFYKDVNRRFVDLVVAQQAIRVREAESEREAFRVEVTRQQVENETLPKGVLIGRELDLELTMLDLESRKRSFQENLDAYWDLLGLAPKDGYEIPDELPPVASSLDELEARVNAFVNNIDEYSSEVRAFQCYVDMYRKILVMDNARNKPKLDATINLSRDSETISTGDRRDLERDKLFGGVRISWNIFDSGESRGAVLQTRELIRQRELELERSRRQIINQLLGQMKDLRTYRQQAELLTIRVRWTTNELKNDQKDVDAGRKPESYLLDTTKRLEGERSRLLSCQASYFKTLTAIFATLEDPAILAYLPKK